MVQDPGAVGAGRGASSPSLSSSPFPVFSSGSSGRAATPRPDGARVYGEALAGGPAQWNSLIGTATARAADVPRPNHRRAGVPHAFASGGSLHPEALIEGLRWQAGKGRSGRMPRSGIPCKDGGGEQASQPARSATMQHMGAATRVTLNGLIDRAVPVPSGRP